MASVVGGLGPKNGLKRVEIHALANFWLNLGDLMLQSPFSGLLQKVFPCYVEYIASQVDMELGDAYKGELSQKHFEMAIKSFNEVSGDSLSFLGSGELQMLQIDYIDQSKLLFLRDKLDQNASLKVSVDTKHSPVQFETQKPEKCLMKILDDPVHSAISATAVYDSAQIPAWKFNSDYFDLVGLLEKQSAVTKLGKERSRIATVKKPFFEICNELNHSKILGKVCLSRKDIVNYSGSGKQSFFPSLDQCYHLIETNKKLFSEAIYQCCHNKIHHLPIMNSNTDPSLGDCSYLDTCHKMRSCRYLHYFTLTPLLKQKKYAMNQEVELRSIKENLYKKGFTIGFSHTQFLRETLPAQWINCDVRYLPFSVLGKFAVILSDPAWDIHMSLPYGTCTDDELMALPMHELQDEGIMLLWVTGRSIEIGRKALNKWGYFISDELIWLKLNQLKRTIVTGRTGHWLNHSKEHLLVGLKGNPPWINRMSDINTIVSGTRETSRKPDEVYDLVERIAGTHSRKLEIFGRDHNVRPGWFTVGNQLSGTSIFEKDVLKKYNRFKSTEPKETKPRKTPNQKRH